MESENGLKLSEKQLQTIASQVTVKVTGDNNGGSGTLLAKRGNSYLVLTNSHVIRGVNTVSLQTSDGKTYPAKIIPNTKLEKLDLALLEFQTNQNYCLAKLTDVLPLIDMPMIAAGFSAEKGAIVFRQGKVQQISQQPLKEGYEIGYNSDIQQGMSGGAIIDQEGMLIGINGRGTYPILNTGYIYEDGSSPSVEEIQQMRKLSWGIPVSRALAQVNEDILTAYSLPLPKTPDGFPPIQSTGWLKKLEEKAKQITVRIDSSSKANGSGIIIAKDGNTYTVLTASHVVCERQKGEDARKLCGDYNYKIIAPDGKQYPVDKSTIKTEEGVDLGVVKFTGTETYEVATLADYNPNNLDYMFTAGYPRLGDKNSPWRFTMGRIFDKEFGLIETTQSDFQSGSSGSLQSASFLKEGYELVYTSITFRGMSGGPVLDSLGRVIGIHGRAEGEQNLDEKTGNCGSSEGQVQIGFSLGIPMSTFLGLATRLGVQPQQVQNTRAPQLDTQQVKSIQQAVLSADVSKGNATATQWLERGNQLWRLRRFEEAVKAFDKAIKLEPSLYLAHYGLGLTLNSWGKDQEAVAALEQAVRYKDCFAIAWALQSSVYRKLNQLDKALIAIDKAIQLQPKNPNLYNEKWVVLGSLKRYSEAEAAISKTIELSRRAVFFNNRGNLYYFQKKWDLALANYNEAIKLNPQSAYIYASRGNAYDELKKWDLALDDYNKAIQLNPQDAFAYNNRGVFYVRQKKWNLALADYNKAIELSPKYAHAYTMRAIFYENQKKWDLALADYTKAIELYSQIADGIQLHPQGAYLNRGKLYANQEKWELALADFNKAIELNPQNGDAYIYRGKVYANREKWDLALADFNKAIQINPQDAIAYINRGNFYKNQKKWDLALVDFNKAIQINPQDAIAYNNRGNFYKNQKKWDLALADYNKAIELNPEYAEAYTYRGVYYVNQQKWDLALADFNKAIQLNTEYALAYNNRGLFYKDQQKWDLALADINKAIQLNPQLASAYNHRGIVYSNQRKWDLALADFNKAIELNPQDSEDVNAYNNRGLLYRNQKKWDLALADYNKAIQLNPEYALAYINRGLFYKDQQKWDLALTDFNKAIELNPQNGDAYYNRGNLYKNQKKWDLALADYNKAIELNSQDADAYNNRGLLYAQQQKWDLALADFNKAIEINPKLTAAYTMRGIFYENQQKWDLALADFNKAILLNPESALTYFNRADLYYKQQKWDLALADLNKVVELNSQFTKAYVKRGLLYIKQQKWDSALADLNKVIELNPQFAFAYTTRGTVHIMKKDKQRAIQDFQQAAQLFQAQQDIANYKRTMYMLKQLQAISKN
jgi:tetratricopeptide (TPR) repeat protein/S1-C subfamily serine protease